VTALLDDAAFEAAARQFEPPPPPRWATPGDLARAIDPNMVQTPALDLIDRVIQETWATPDGRLIVSMPPQEGKSERVTKTGSLWRLTQDPQTRIGIVSYAQSLAEGFSRDVRNWITTNDGTDGTLDLELKISRDNGSARRWQLDGKRGGCLAAGVESGITGRPLDGIVIDDPFANDRQGDSAYYRDLVHTRWRSTWSTRLAPGAPAIVILTRWHEDDIAGRLTAAEDGKRWRVINIPALADHDPAKGEVDVLGREPGQWLISSRGRTVEQWEDIRVQAGSRVFNALYQGRPSPSAGNVWRRTWWRFYETPLWTLAEDGSYLVDADEVVQSWDCTFKDTKGSDFVVCTVWARRGASVYLLYKVRKRLSFTDTLVQFKAVTAMFPQANAKFVEDKANGTAVIDALRREIPGIIAVNPTESKYARANAVAPFVQAGNVWLPAPHCEIPGTDADGLVEEAAAFPNGAHDDQVDSVSQALGKLLLRAGQGAVFLAAMKARAEADHLPVATTARDWRTRIPNGKAG
jgi:predicted phage terminase large subunit-like protein